MWSRIACGLVFATGILGAQEAINHGSISGRVTDPSGAVIEGAQITARCFETNQTASVRTDREGRFRLPYLRPGTYRITVSQEGFSNVVRSLGVSPGATYDLPFPLAIESAGTSVGVVGDTWMLENARTQIAGAIPEAEARNSPLNGRSFLDLALLVPGVSPANTGSNQLFAETSAVPGQGISVSAQRNFSNNFVVDGLSANDDAAGLSGVFYSLDTVQELQVVSSGAQAELGRALGGIVSVTTKSGTNELHGDLYEYFRNTRMNAANPLSNTRLPSTQSQHGAAVGGPLLRNRTFYFANFEQRILNQSGLTTITPANVAIINAKLDATGYPGARIATGVYPNPVRLANVFGKVDHQFGSRDLFTARYSLYDVNSRNARGAGGLSTVTASSNLDSADHNVAFSNILTITPGTVNETRGQYGHSRLDAPPTDPVGPAVNISGIASFGTLSSSPSGRSNGMYEVINNISHQGGSHALRAGFNFVRNGNTIVFPRAVNGSYSFSSLANFLQGVYNNSGFTQTFGNTRVSQSNPNAGFFVQDEWKAAPSLTFNAGLRYDLQFLETIATDRNNVSPRAGFAWSPLQARRTVIRGGFGLFYDRLPLRALANALLSSANSTALGPASQVSVSLTPGQAGAPVFPAITTALPGNVLVNFTTMDRAIQNAYSSQGSLEFEQQIGADTTISIGYQHVRGLHLVVAVNQNVPACIGSGTNNGCRPNPSYANNSRYSSLADSWYDGLHVSLRRRPSQWVSYRLSYTYSKSFNNAGEFFFSSPIDHHDIWKDYGRSDEDQRHRLVLNGTLHSPVVDVSSIVQYYSTLPMNITTGATTIQGTAARPVVNGAYIDRNAGAGSDYFNVNLRVSRTFPVTDRIRIEALAEAFNALNHRNNLTKNGVFGSGPYPSNPSPSFGQVTAVYDARVLQFALRLRF